MTMFLCCIGAGIGVFVAFNTGGGIAKAIPYGGIGLVIGLVISLFMGSRGR